jgi:hypothetical protein
VHLKAHFSLLGCSQTRSIVAQNAQFFDFLERFFGNLCETAEFLPAYISLINARPLLLAGLVKPQTMLNRLLRHVCDARDA